LVIEIWDCGDPFDWDAKLAALRREQHNPLEKESGRGLMFMEQLSQRVRYRRYGGRNCLMVRKVFPA
jgi:serine/threonine-protein kinase RsbW